MKTFYQKYFLSITFFIALLLTVSTASHGNEMRSIHTIKIVTPHWENQTNTDGTGLFFEIIQSVYEPAGIKMSFKFVPWKRAQALVNDKNADAMLCVWQEHADEEHQILPRYPMFIEHTAVVFKKDKSILWDGIQTLNQKSAVWLRGYDYHHFKQLRHIEFKQFHEVDTYEMAWMHLNMDRYDVYIDALIDMDIYIRKNALDMSQYHKKILWGEKAYPAFSESDRSKKLIEIYDKQIKILFETGKLRRIYEKWDVQFFPEYWEDQAAD